MDITALLLFLALDFSLVGYVIYARVDALPGFLALLVLEIILVLMLVTTGHLFPKAGPLFDVGYVLACIYAVAPVTLMLTQRLDDGGGKVGSLVANIGCFSGMLAAVLVLFSFLIAGTQAVLTLFL